MIERMTDERLVAIEYVENEDTRLELHAALVTERKHWEAEDESMCDHQMRWQLMKDRIAELEAQLQSAESFVHTDDIERYMVAKRTAAQEKTDDQ
jgi:hypothetical protein